MGDGTAASGAWPGAPRVCVGGVTFRDLNGNGRLDPYEDPHRPIEERVADLLGQMTLDEKAGLMFVAFAGSPMDDEAKLLAVDIARTPAGQMVTVKRMRHLNFPGIRQPGAAAEWQNRMQVLAEQERLSIPITFVSDPRNSFSNNPAVSARRGRFSQWPEPIGLAAIGDEVLTQEFADMARQEYLAIGIRCALHPMADLATEPRWGRINGTFGEDAELSARMVRAYIQGFQGWTIGSHSVTCMTKHFPGGGPQKDGNDPHFPYGKEQVYPGDNFAYHLIPFEAALEAGTAQIMPYYGQPIGVPGIEEVGFSYNRDVITGLLRRKYGFDGVVCTDWGLVTDHPVGDGMMLACAWGVEHLGREERVLRLLEAGVDMLGGETCAEIVVRLVREGRVPEARLDQSCRRILRDKFRLGLFDDPFTDPVAAEQIVGNERFSAAGAAAQRRSIVLLKNGAPGGLAPLPLSGRPRLYLENVRTETAAEYGDVVAGVAEADMAIVRLDTPYQPRPGANFLERMFHAGDLDFKGEALERILGVLASVPTVVVMHLDRPAVIPEISERCAALLGEFGASDEAVLDVIFGRAVPEGKLPFELPSSMAAVRAQHPDVPYDSQQPLYPFGHGLRM